MRKDINKNYINLYNVIHIKLLKLDVDKVKKLALPREKLHPSPTLALNEEIRIFKRSDNDAVTSI